MLKGALRGLGAATHPLWMCGFRPFFCFTAISAPLLIGLWTSFLAFGLPLPAVPGGFIIWHAHELIFGVAPAAIAGFTLTAIPEFTRTGAFDQRLVRLLAGLWLIGRVGFWSSGAAGVAALLIAAAAHLGFIGVLVAQLAPRLWRDPDRRHLAFLWTLGALAVGIGGFYFDALRGVYPARWLHASLGVLMMLMIVAMSRISMRIVNAAIERVGGAGVEYRARPPRRNLAVCCIAFYTIAEFWMPGSRLAGWLALAAAAALFNLLNDWFVGRALFVRWPLMLCCVYVYMAAGYGMMGLSMVLETNATSAGRHLLTIGALGLNIYLVMCIAGRIHAGRPLDAHLWVPLGAMLIMAAAVVRAMTGLLDGPVTLLLAGSGLLWSIGFILCAWYLVPVWLAPRSDRGVGCEGILED